MPPAKTGSGGGSVSRYELGVGVDITATTMAAPAAEAATPTGVTAPEEPAGIVAQGTIDRGGWPERGPISVAQVSAAAAATAPAKPVLSSRMVPGDVLAESRARSAATPPFARTCT